MSEGFRDGLFYHPDGFRPDDIAARLCRSEVNVRLDDPFAVAIQDTLDRQELLKREREGLEDKLQEVKRRLADVDEHEVVLAKLLNAQRAAVQHYDETGEIDDVLIPRCEQAFQDKLAAYKAELAEASKAEREASEAECDAAIKEVPQLNGWQVDRSRCDDEFVYITLKKRRHAAPSIEPPSRDAHIQTVRKSIDLFRSPTLDRRRRIRVAPGRIGRELTKLRGRRHTSGP